MIKKTFICTVCTKSFAVENNLKQHMQIAHMLPKIGTTGSIENLEWEIVKPNENGRISCLDCNETFSSLQTAKSHHKEVHIREFKFDCLFCNKSFNIEDNMKLHVLVVHMVPKIEANGSIEHLFKGLIF